MGDSTTANFAKLSREKLLKLFSNTDFVCGSIGGALGITISHPWSTYKNRMQSNPRYSVLRDIARRSPITLYSGFLPPLIGTVAEKAVLFGVYDILNKNTDLGDFTKGYFAGVATTVIVTPYELVMIHCQLRRISARRAIRQVLLHHGVSGFFRGYTSTLFREVPGYAIYFSAFAQSQKYLQNEDENASIIKTAVSGAVAGVSAWSVIYPADVIKTHMQNTNAGLLQSTRHITSAYGFLGFFNGIKPALFRAGLLHAGVFVGYKKSKDYFA